MQVQNFSYNGFSGQLKDGLTPYTAEFLKWTDDPGIAKCKCSDGKVRLIPTFALLGFRHADYPKQKKTGVIFGTPCYSQCLTERQNKLPESLSRRFNFVINNLEGSN